MTDEEIKELVITSRAAQGLPPTVQDPSMVELAVKLLKPRSNR